MPAPIRDVFWVKVAEILQTAVIITQQLHQLRFKKILIYLKINFWLLQ